MPALPLLTIPTHKYPCLTSSVAIRPMTHGSLGLVQARICVVQFQWPKMNLSKLLTDVFSNQ